MTCKLCLKDKEIIDSHIIPDFFYKGVKDIHGGIIRIDNSNEKQRIGFPKSGEYEKLLCFDCDNKRIGQLDNYASSLVGNESVLSFEDDTRQIVFPVIFKKYKLFLLSIVWRASIAKRFFWANINLPKSTEEQLRLQILKRKLYYENYFPCVGLRFHDKKIKNPFFVMSPLHYKSDRTEFFTFIFGGYMWIFFQSIEDYLVFNDYPLIQNDDKLYFPKKSLSKIPFLDDEVKESMRNGIK
ncbi:MAG: hypothetical protein WD059_04680 [Balneolaceae bacterium]